MLDLRLLPDPGRTANTDVLIGTLSSDITFGLFFNGLTNELTWKLRLSPAIPISWRDQTAFITLVEG